MEIGNQIQVTESNTSVNSVNKKDRVKLVRTLLTNPLLSTEGIATTAGVSKQYVYRMRYAVKHEGKSKVKDKMAKFKPENKLTLKVTKASDIIKHSNVFSPPHYTDGGISTLEYIQAKKLGYLLGNVVKYVSRAGKKKGATELEDLYKASVYLEERIKELELSDRSEK